MTLSVSENYRIEHDLIGELPVPKDALYGIHTLRALHNFNLSPVKLKDLPELTRALCLLKRAYANANTSLGLLSPEIDQSISKACDRIYAGEFKDHLQVDAYQGGAGTSTNMNFNEVLANLAGQSLGHPLGSYAVSPLDHVNLGQSTNDVYPSACKMALLEVIYSQVLPSTRSLVVALDNAAIRFKGVRKMGRTQLQEAVPMLVSDEVQAWRWQLTKAVDNLIASSKELRVLNLGATAIGTGVAAHPNLGSSVINKLNLLIASKAFHHYHFELADNLIGSTSDTSSFVSVSSSLKRLALVFGKLCNDLRLLSSGPLSGFAEYVLPERQAGSSIMAGKVNPVILEAGNQAVYAVMGVDTVVEHSSSGGQLQLNAFEPLIVTELLLKSRILSNSIEAVARLCVADLALNTPKLSHSVQHSAGLATLLLPLLGYEKTLLVAKLARSSAISVEQACRQLGLDSPSVLSALRDGSI